MSYTAVRGGEGAIRAAEAMEDSRARGAGLSVEAVLKGMRYAVDAVMSEAGLHAPELAARAVVEAQGDLAEAAFLLRAYRSTLPRIGYTEPTATGEMRLVRRVSSAFKDVPGGQVLGATRDYSQRLLGLRDRETRGAADGSQGGNGSVRAEGEGRLPRITDLLREAGLVARRKEPGEEAVAEPFVLTRTAPKPRREL